MMRTCAALIVAACPLATIYASRPWRASLTTHVQEAAHEVWEFNGSARESTLEAEAVLGSDLASHLDSIGCCYAREVEPDYPYFAAILKILVDIGRPFYLGGGSGINLVRFGAMSVNPTRGSERRVAFDDDFDFAVHSSSDEDRQELNNTLQKKCREAGIFKDCTDWFRITYAAGKGMATDYADFYDLRDLNASHMHLINWGKAGRSWVIERDTLFPLRMAKYYDLRVPVPSKSLKFFSEAVPFDNDGLYPEYGEGCEGMAFPQFLTKALSGSDDSQRRFAKSELKLCAQALSKKGFASFAECTGA